MAPKPAATYTSPVQGAGFTYTWTASPAGDFTVSSGSNPTFQTANVASAGAGTIALTETTPCRQFFYSRNIIFGAPAPIDYTDDPVASDPCNKIIWYIINNYNPYLTYTGTGLAGISYGRFRVKGGSGTQTRAFTVTATNDYGTTSISDVADFTNCPYGLRYTAYPNPADDALTVEQTDSTGTQRPTAARGAAATTTNSSTAPSTPYTVRLFDSYGVQQVQQATTSPTVQLATGSLPTGLYLLHSEVGGVMVERRRLQITH